MKMNIPESIGPLRLSCLRMLVLDVFTRHRLLGESKYAGEEMRIFIATFRNPVGIFVVHSGRNKGFH